jgi:hypothetical protein
MSNYNGLKIVWFADNNATPTICYPLCNTEGPEDAIRIISKFQEIISNDSGIANPMRHYRFLVTGSNEVLDFEELLKSVGAHRMYSTIPVDIYWVLDGKVFAVPPLYLIKDKEKRDYLLSS